MVIKKSPTHDAAFEAFLRQQRIDTPRRRRQAVEDLLAFVATAPPRTGTREWQQAARFILGLHGIAWLDEPRVFPPDRVEPRPRVTAVRVRQVHAELRRGLSLLFPIDDDRHGEPRLWPPPIRKQHHLALVHYHHQLSRIVEASWPDTIWIAVMGLLEEFGRQFRRCPTCAERRLFHKRKRQQYCSRTCSQRERSARWYRQHRKKVLVRRHEAYTRTILKGRKGIVARRPRSTLGT